MFFKDVVLNKFTMLQEMAPYPEAYEQHKLELVGNYIFQKAVKSSGVQGRLSGWILDLPFKPCMS